MVAYRLLPSGSLHSIILTIVIYLPVAVRCSTAELALRHIQFLLYITFSQHFKCSPSVQSLTTTLSPPLSVCFSLSLSFSLSPDSYLPPSLSFSLPPSISLSFSLHIFLHPPYL